MIADGKKTATDNCKTTVGIRALQKAVADGIPCWKGCPAKFGAAGKCFFDFPAAQHAIPAKVWALSGKENYCW